MMRTLGNRRKVDTGDFVGRANEQQQFRATLRELERIRTVRDADLSEDVLYAQIFLVAAEGGMGKTTLMRRFEVIATENNEQSAAKALYINLEEYHQRTPIGRNIEQFVEVLHQALCVAGFADELAPFRKERERRNAAHRKADDAAQQYSSMAALGGRMVEFGSGGLIERELAKEGVHAAAKLVSEVRAFVQRKLSDDEWQLYDQPHVLSKKLMECINALATPKRPLVLLLDTYEVADGCDAWLRDTLLLDTGPRLVWVIAGRANPEWFKSYEQAFKEAVRPVDLKTFNRGEIESYLQQCRIEPTPSLIAQLDGLSRGLPLALKAWVDLHRKGVALPEPSRDATTKREIVRQVTERFLRYCDDDKGYDPADRAQRREQRDTIMSFLLLRRTDHAALAAMRQTSRTDVEKQLDTLNDQFSFIFADAVTRTPHALVREFTCEDMRRNPLRESVRAAVGRLRDFTAQQLAERERELQHSSAATALPTAVEHQHVHELRTIAQRNLYGYEEQIAKYTDLNAPVHMLTERKALQQQIADYDRQLATAATPAPDAPRRPLWHDERWCDWLLDYLNALTWCEPSGEQVLHFAVPLLLEASMFNRTTAAAMIDVLEPATASWAAKHGNAFEILKKGRFQESWATMNTELQAMLPVFERYQTTPLQQAILKLHTAKIQRADNQLAQAVASVDEAARLLPADGGELRPEIGSEYAQLGNRYLWRDGRGMQSSRRKD